MQRDLTAPGVLQAQPRPTPMPPQPRCSDILKSPVGVPAEFPVPGVWVYSGLEWCQCWSAFSSCRGKTEDRWRSGPGWATGGPGVSRSTVRIPSARSKAWERRTDVSVLLEFSAGLIPGGLELTGTPSAARPPCVAGAPASRRAGKAERVLGVGPEMAGHLLPPELVVGGGLEWTMQQSSQLLPGRCRARHTRRRSCSSSESPGRPPNVG